EERSIKEGLKWRCGYGKGGNWRGGDVVVQVYLCPTEPRKTLWNRDSGDAYDYADGDYGGMYGPRGLGDPTFTNNPPRGPMIFNAALSLAQITDGASQTIQVGEDPEAIHALWISGHN